MSIATSGEKAPGKRRSLLELSAARSAVLFWETDVAWKSISTVQSEDPAIVASLTLELDYIGNDVQARKPVRRQLGKARRCIQKPPPLVVACRGGRQRVEFANIIRSRERPRTKRMCIGHRQLIDQNLTVFAANLDTPAECFLSGV